MTEADDKIRCDACPVLCYIRPGMTGACDRYANRNGELVRVDPHVLLERTVKGGGEVVPFMSQAQEWSGDIVNAPAPFVTAVGAGTTYPDYKPAPFIVSSRVEGVDMVTVVTEGIYSYCGVKLKIDTDRHLGAECATVRAKGIGEQALIPTAPAILNAIHHATGVRIRRTPATPDRVRAAILSLQNEKKNG